MTSSGLNLTGNHSGSTTGNVLPSKGPLLALYPNLHVDSRGNVVLRRHSDELM